MEVIGKIDKLFQDDRSSALVEQHLLQNDLSYFSEKILNMEIASHHLEWSDLIARYKRIGINASRDHGKTAVKSTTCVLSNGDIRSIAEVKVGDKVLSLGDDWKVHPRMVEHVQCCGEKECVEITTQSGRKTKLALTHPLLKFKPNVNPSNTIDWISVEKGLREGDQIAVYNNPKRADAKRQSSDSLWDKIVSIKPIGKHECWDLQVEKDHNYIADDIFSHNSFFFCFAYALWRAYHHWIPPDLGDDFKSIPRISLGYIFSNTQDQAIKHLEIIKHELETNPRLEHLVPDKKEIWSKQEIRLKNNAIIRARGWGVSVRGAHPCHIVCDDVLGEENLYSEITRRKEKEYLFSAVTPMLVPGGQLVVVGCVEPNTYVITKDGPKKIGQLAPSKSKSKALYPFNQSIFGENGFKNATHYWVNGKCKTKKIKVAYGLELEGSHRHPIRVLNGKTLKTKSIVWRRMDELRIGDRVVIEIGQNQYGKWDSPDWAYSMGLWTAEGNETKVVPKRILEGTKRTQQAFIRGFVDVNPILVPKKKGQQINLCSSSKELIDRLRAMLMNMGIMPSYQLRKPAVSKLVKGKLPSHNLVISGGYAHKFMNEIGLVWLVTHKKKKFAKGPAPNKFFALIKSIEDSECETVDFVIPKDHTFCSNGMISHNTPLHDQDLYSDLKTNPQYHFDTYPACDPNFSRALWPTRYSLDRLKQIREEVGSTRFAREYQCIAVSEESSLFPERIISECFDHDFEMPTALTKEEQHRLRVYTGVDLAMSTSVGADYTVILTIGVDEFQNRWILDIRRKKGLSMTEQLREIEDVYRNYNPMKILIEDNNFQRVFKDELVKRTDMPVEGFTTTRYNKNSIEKGIPSLQILFENKKFVIARKTERDRRLTDILVHELRCFSWQDGKLQGVGAHDDVPMALWFASEACSSSPFSFTFA